MDLGRSHAKAGYWAKGTIDPREEELDVFAERVNLGGFDNKQHA